MIVVKKRYEFEPLGLRHEFAPLDYRKRAWTLYRVVNYKTIVGT